MHASVVDEFARRLTEQASQLKLGFGLEENVTQGPLVNKCSVEKVARHVRDALDHEGELLFGGNRPSHLGNGYFFEPTIIKNATTDMAVAQEETSGPLAAISSFRDSAQRKHLSAASSRVVSEQKGANMDSRSTRLSSR